MKHIYLLSHILLFTFASSILFAVPASDREFSIIQPDNSELTIKQIGNEFVHWITTTDGYTIVKNSNDVFEYANENYIASGIKAHNIYDRTTEENKYLSQVTKYIMPKADLKAASIRPKYQSGTFPTTGTNKLLLILVRFSDSDTTFSQSEFNDFMNKDGGINGNGSFRQYYLENSYGQLDITTTVTKWVTLPKSRSYYSVNLWDNILEFAYDAVVAADNAGIDFSEYDNDKNGIVDGIAIIHTGKGQEDSRDENDIWSHSWAISEGNYTKEELTFDGVLVDSYTTQAEIIGSGISQIGVICHEFGHNLGAPDYYDVNLGGNSIYKGTGKWDLMGFGAWNGTPSGSSPASHNMYQKEQFGWIKLPELATDSTYSIKNSAKYDEGYIINTAKQGEYFILENKQQTGFDKGIPGHGLIIYHVDENHISEHWWDNDINISEHQGIYIKVARDSTNSEACPFPGTNNITSFTDTSTPNSLSWDGYETQKPITGITEIDSVITFTIGGIERPTWNQYSINNDTVISLSWNKNSQNDSIILVWSYYPFNQTLRNDTIYTQGFTFSDSSKIMYIGTAETTYNFNTAPYGEYQYFTLYSKNSDNYSSGVVAETVVTCPSEINVPYIDNFENYNAFGPGICWQIMRGDTTEIGLQGNNLEPVSITTGDDTWRINNDITNIYLDNAKHDSIQSMVIDAFDNKLHWLITPEITIPQGHSYLLFDIFYKTNGGSGLFDNQFMVKVFSDNTWSYLIELNNDENNLYKNKIELSLNEYLNKKVKVAFIYNALGTYPLAIDSIAIDGSDNAKVFDVEFSVLSLGLPVENAEVSFNNETRYTDSYGKTTFSSVNPGNNLTYTVNKDGFGVSENNFNLVNNNKTVDINITPSNIEQDKKTEPFIFPNPAKDIIEISNFEKGSITIINISGITLLSENMEQNKYIDISQLPKGLYFVKIEFDNQVILQKLVKE